MEYFLQKTVIAHYYREACLFLLTILGLLLLFWWKKQKLPPGPWGFPIVGHLPLLTASPHIKLTEWHKKYGDIYRIHMGTRPTIVINTLSLMKDAFLKQKGDFDSRPDFDSFKTIQGGHSLAFGYHPQSWILQKKVMKIAMKLYNRDPNHAIDRLINEESNRLIEELVKHSKTNPNGCVDPASAIHIMSSTIIYRMCYGHGDNENPQERPEFQDFLRNHDEFGKIQAAGGNPGDLIPELGFLFQARLKEFNALIQRFCGLVDRVGEELTRTFDSQKGLRNIVDAINQVIESIPQNELELSGMKQKDFIQNTSDLVGAAKQTIVSVLLWFLLYSSLYPQIQEKMRKEIKAKVGKDCDIKLSDRLKLPYTEAVLLETMRMGVLLPTLLPHVATKDTHFHGYDIAKGTLVMLNMYAISRDPQLWDEPMKFKPERFLIKKQIDSSAAISSSSSSGNEEEFIINRDLTDRFPAFGLGRRRCVGEWLGRAESFIVAVRLIQQLEFDLIPHVNYTTDGVYSLALDPKPFSLIVKPSK